MKPEGIALGAFLDDIVAPLLEMPRLGRPSIVDEALAAVHRPENTWIRMGMIGDLASPEVWDEHCGCPDHAADVCVCNQHEHDA